MALPDEILVDRGDVYDAATLDNNGVTSGGTTILSANIQFTNVSSLRSWSSATISNTALAADDVLRVVITVAGAAGAQAAGLVVELTMIPVDPS